VAINLDILENQYAFKYADKNQQPPRSRPDARNQVTR